MVREFHSTVSSLGQDVLFSGGLLRESSCRVMAYRLRFSTTGGVFHALIKELLSDLEKQEGAEFEKNFQALKAEVQLHFTEEENEIFPQVTNLKKDRDLDRLAEQLATNKKEYRRTAPQSRRKLSA